MTPQLPKSAVDQTLALAIKAHQSGQRAQAAKLYQDVLKIRPKDPQVLYLLGALYHELKESEQARSFLELSIALRPAYAPAQSMLGVVYSSLGDGAKAVKCFGFAAKTTPTSADAHFNLARARLDQALYAEAAESYQRAIQLRPDHSPSYTGLVACYSALHLPEQAIAALNDAVKRFPNLVSLRIALGRQLLDQKKTIAAADVFQGCINDYPDEAEAMLLLGSIRLQESNFKDAEALFRRVLVLAPDDPVANNFLGVALQALGRFDDSERTIKKAFAARPNDPEIVTNLGLALERRGESFDAASFHRQAIALKPDHAGAWNNLGVSLQNLGDWDEALRCYDKAISLRAEFYLALTNKAHALLALGRLKEGWRDYAYRFDKKFLAPSRRIFPYPQWTPRADETQTLLLWSDQGVGDEVLYSSMIQDAVQVVGQRIFECSARMAPLFQRSFPHISVVPRATPPDQRITDAKPDAQIALSELGQHFRPDLSSFPSHAGYLKPDPDVRAALRAQYKAIAGHRRIVGISWKSENPLLGGFKSVPLSQWGPIFAAPDILFVSLQYGNVRDDLAAVSGMAADQLLHDPDVDPIADLDRSAAQIAAMDLVISTSNTTAHFAGALNVPVFVLAPTGPGSLWYWFNDRRDSPWYPSMKLFRQSRPGDWAPVVDAVGQHLMDWASP